MNEEQKKKAEQEHKKLIVSELGMYGAKLKHTGSGGYLGHGEGKERPKYKPDEDKQYKVQPK